jgi:hypothetical protein
LRDSPGRLQLELGPPPVAPLGVVADRVARAHADPLRDRPVLLQLLGQLRFDAKCLVGRLKQKRGGNSVTVKVLS